MKSKMQKFALAKKKIDVTKKRKNFQKIQQKRKKPRQTDDAEIEALSARLWPSFDQSKEEIKPSDIKNFTDLPISKKTLEGLKTHRFFAPTDIQRESLMFGLKGFDILGAAKTGSGKTLAFLIPILETLFKQRYTPSFGMAALVISPTRELAYQSFDVLKKIGKLHDLSFGLVTGGMPLKEEAKKMNYTNVVICTPGRLLQHFEQTPNFTADELKVLVLDEADRILHMGFSETMNAIVEALPRQRQTLLFSATQTKSVKDLARLSLKKPIYVSVHEKAKESTPTALDQRYVVCEMQDKINTLWSFLKSHRQKKILVFLSCCKQTRYLYQVFKLMHPGLTVLCLHGHMKQQKRMEVYESFSRKQHAVLLATDVAARGLDFPAVNWVVQLDKPENANTYIHRVGRTARYEKSGDALLVLLSTEEQKMVEDLHKRKIPIAKLKVSKKRMFDVTKKLESLCAADKDLKDNAQKAFISVMKTLHVLDKPSFENVDREAFAACLGLVQAPRLPFLDKARKETKSSMTKASEINGENISDDESIGDESESDSGENDSDEGPESNTSEADAKAVKKSSVTLNFGVDSDDDEDSSDDNGIYSVVKDVRKFNDPNDAGPSGKVKVSEPEKSGQQKSRAKEKLRLLKYTTRITFDEEGNPDQEEESDEETQGLDIAKAKQRMKEEDKRDREMYRQKVKEQHREKRLKLKEKRRQAELEKRGQTADDELEVTLGNPEDASDNEGAEDGASKRTARLEGDDSDDEPVAKRQRLDRCDDNEESSDDEEMDNDDDDDDDDDDDTEDESDSESDVETETIAKEEASVLAMLSSKR